MLQQLEVRYNEGYILGELKYKLVAWKLYIPAPLQRLGGLLTDFPQLHIFWACFCPHH